MEWNLGKQEDIFQWNIRKGNKRIDLNTFTALGSINC